MRIQKSNLTIREIKKNNASNSMDIEEDTSPPLSGISDLRVNFQAENGAGEELLPHPLPDMTGVLSQSSRWWIENFGGKKNRFDCAFLFAVKFWSKIDKRSGRIEHA